MRKDTPTILSIRGHKGFDTDRLQIVLSYFRHLVNLREYINNRRHELFQPTDGEITRALATTFLRSYFQSIKIISSRSADSRVNFRVAEAKKVANRYRKGVSHGSVSILSASSTY